jgi:hypothetical protein
LPRVIRIDQGAAKTNLFKVPGGYVMPVTLGGAAASSSITVRGLLEILAGKTPKCEVIHPGETDWKECAFRQKDSAITLKVPLTRGCAMVRIVV